MIITPLQGLIIIHPQKHKTGEELFAPRNLKKWLNSIITTKISTSL